MSRESFTPKTLALAILMIAVLALPPAGIASAAEPTNGIITPSDGATVSGPAEVTGYADDPLFAKWQLDVLPGGDAAKAANLAVGKKSGSFSYVMDTSRFPAGAHALRLRIVHPDGNYQEFLSDFVIGAPVIPTNGITSPKSGTVVSGKVAVKGYANDPIFDRWQLDVLPGGDTAAAPVALTVSDVPGYFTYSLDAAALPAGTHALRLRVVRTDGNYAEFLANITVPVMAPSVGSTFEAFRGNPGGGL